MPAVTIADGPGAVIGYLLSDVAAKTMVPKRRLLDDCRAGILDHNKAGGRRFMTDAQIAAMLEYYRVKPTQVTEPVVDEVEQARRMTRRSSASRATPRRVG